MATSGFTRTGLIALLSAAACLSGCQMGPQPIRSGPEFYSGPLEAETIRQLGGLKVVSPAQLPSRTVWTSAASRKPLYGLLNQVPVSRLPPAQRALTPDRLLDASRELPTRLQAALPSAPSDARGRVQLIVHTVNIYAMDVREQRCTPQLTVEAQVRDERQRLIWTTGLIASALSESQSWPCPALRSDLAVARQAVRQRLQPLLAEVARRMQP